MGDVIHTLPAVGQPEAQLSPFETHLGGGQPLGAAAGIEPFPGRGCRLAAQVGSGVLGPGTAAAHFALRFRRRLPGAHQVRRGGFALTAPTASSASTARSCANGWRRCSTRASARRSPATSWTRTWNWPPRPAPPASSSSFPLPEGAPEGDLPPGDFLLACPLAGWPSKQWPLEYYERLAALVRQQWNIPLVLNGPPSAAAVLRSVKGVTVKPLRAPGADPCHPPRHRRHRRGQRAAPSGRRAGQTGRGHLRPHRSGPATALTEVRFACCGRPRPPPVTNGGQEIDPSMRATLPEAGLRLAAFEPLPASEFFRLMPVLHFPKPYADLVARLRVPQRVPAGGHLWPGWRLRITARSPSDCPCPSSACCCAAGPPDTWPRTATWPPPARMDHLRKPALCGGR